MKTVEEVIADIPEAQIFLVLDANSGFMQIELDDESSLLTTFNTPIGRYRWLRLPFGIKCATEIFQRIMDNMLEGIQGAAAIMDDILVAGKNMKDHDMTLRKVIEKATEYNLKLNMDKCSICQTSVTYVGLLLTADGLKPDLNKVRAVLEMPTPTDKEAVRRFLRFVTYLSKFIPNLSEIDAPLRELVKTDVMFSWQPEQEQAFRKLQDMCSSPPVLAYYDVSKPVQIECDASQNGLGGVILQENHPIAYTSRSLRNTEKRYAQIEKETLSVLHACKKFHNYIFGKPVTVFNDHKPLVAIFSKPLLSVPMRLQTALHPPLLGFARRIRSQ